MMDSGQVRSRQRVTDHGEVYTNPREVNAMLDLVKNETERIESRFLEPACGHGNFLTAILERKLDAVASRYGRSREEYEAQALLGLGCIYGIDKLGDNVEEARGRLFTIFENRYRTQFKASADERVLDVARFILERNLIRGNALTLKVEPEEQEQSFFEGRPTLDDLRNDGEPIIFSEWRLIDSFRVKRKDYLFEELLNRTDGPLFSDQGEEIFLAKPVRDYLTVHYLKLLEEITA